MLSHDFVQRVNSRTPPSDDSRPPSNLATTVLPETGDRPGSGSIGSLMAGVALPEMARIGFDNQILH